MKLCEDLAIGVELSLEITVKDCNLKNAEWPGLRNRGAPKRILPQCHMQDSSSGDGGGYGLPSLGSSFASSCFLSPTNPNK